MLDLGGRLSKWSGAGNAMENEDSSLSLKQRYSGRLKVASHPMELGAIFLRMFLRETAIRSLLFIGTETPLLVAHAQNEC